MKPFDELGLPDRLSEASSPSYIFEFRIGDWRKPHKLTTSKVKGDHPDLAAVSCSCGWAVMTGAEMAKRLGRMHLERANA